MADEPDANLIKELASFFQEIDAMVLATVDGEGLPHATNIYMAHDRRFNLYFLSDARSEHSQHIEAQPRVSIAGHAPIRMWQQVRGIQIRGKCVAVPEAQRPEAWAIYHERFPYIEDISEHVRAMTFYCVEPERLRWIDNSVHFGYKVDLHFPLPASLQAASDEHHG